jgi:hypothetical protein
MAGVEAGLMSEEEVREYFVVRGGLVRNNDIVTHFRNYLANPPLRGMSNLTFPVRV